MTANPGLQQINPSTAIIGGAIATARQGDIFLERIDTLPGGLAEAPRGRLAGC
jgi:hypothetical protein